MAEATVSRGNRLLLEQWVELLEDDSFRRFWLMRLASHTAVNALPYSISGVAVDRLPRGLILCGANLLRAALVLLLVSAKDSLPSLYAIALGFGVLGQFAGPAEAAIVPHVVHSRRLVAANSFMQLGTLMSQVLGLLVLAPISLKTGADDFLLLLAAGLFCLGAVLTTIIPQFHFTSPGDGRGGV